MAGAAAGLNRGPGVQLNAEGTFDGHLSASAVSAGAGRRYSGGGADPIGVRQEALQLPPAREEVVLVHRCDERSHREQGDGEGSVSVYALRRMQEGGSVHPVRRVEWVDIEDRAERPGNPRLELLTFVRVGDLAREAHIARPCRRGEATQYMVTYSHALRDQSVIGGRGVQRIGEERTAERKKDQDDEDDRTVEEVAASQPHTESMAL